MRSAFLSSTMGQFATIFPQLLNLSSDISVTCLITTILQDSLGAMGTDETLHRDTWANFTKNYLSQIWWKCVFFSQWNSNEIVGTKCYMCLDNHAVMDYTKIVPILLPRTESEKKKISIEHKFTMTICIERGSGSKIHQILNNLVQFWNVVRIKIVTKHSSISLKLFSHDKMI